MARFDQHADSPTKGAARGILRWVGWAARLQVIPPDMSAEWLRARQGRLSCSDRSSAYPIAQVEHPDSLDHHVSILEQVLYVD